MLELIAHATKLGVTVRVAHLEHPYAGYYDSERKIVVYDFDLTPIERRSVLAHELGHAYYDHQCQDDRRGEDAADLYAAYLLIDPRAYVAAEKIDPSPAAIADELGVTEEVVHTYEKRALTRLHGVTYVGSRMGARQFRWSG
jgi:Zn-dependent peptidase ImmA (M78 family)